LVNINLIQLGQARRVIITKTGIESNSGIGNSVDIPGFGSSGKQVFKFFTKLLN